MENPETKVLPPPPTQLKTAQDVEQYLLARGFHRDALEKINFRELLTLIKDFYNATTKNATESEIKKLKKAIKEILQALFSQPTNKTEERNLNNKVVDLRAGLFNLLKNN